MVGSEGRASAQQRGGPGWRRAASIWIPAGTILLVVALVALVAGCSSGTQVGSNSAGTAVTATTAADQTGTQTSGPTGMPGGTPPTDSSGQIVPPQGGSNGQTPVSGPTGAGANTSSTQTTTTTTQVDASTTTTQTTVAQASTTTTSLAKGQYGDGVYHVGSSYDISSGLYRGTVVGDTGHWEISSDADGVKFVASGDPTGPFYVKVTSGQYLRLSGVIIEKASTKAADPLATSNITDGTYRVGYDIATGWYNGTVNDTMGYWEISSDANGTKLVANDYPLGPFTLHVSDGQYLTLRGVTVSQ